MRTILLLSAAFIACGATAAPATTTDAAAKTKAKACEAKYYSNLVGKDIAETQLVTGDYRLLPEGAARGEPRASRMTIVYDARTKLILGVDCG